MKLIHKIVFVILIPASLVTGSCKKSFFTDVNVNPNVLTDVSPNLLLPTVEAALAYTQGGDISRYSALLMQQMYGAASQSQQYYQYNFNPGNFDNLWPDLYTSTMENNHTLIKISDAGGYNAYSGIARIIMAYTLQVSVDLWGDLPYSQAFQGNVAGGSLHPAYDKAAALYDSASNLIDAGIVFLNAASQGSITPSTDDVIYEGDAAKWIKFGHAIKARLAIHQSKGSVAMATKALNEIAQSFTSNDENAQYIFGTQETSANTWYQFYRDRPGDENFESSTLAIQLKASGDPRYPIYDMDSTYKGANTSYYNMINSPVEFITYDELQFISAEATLRSTGDLAAAQTFFQAAITADLTKVGIPQATINTFVTANGTLSGSTDAAIAKVAAQEYIALFLNPEAWTLWRRTGSPALTTSSPGNEIPRRLLYPQSEINFNATNVPANVTLYSPRIFWDN